MLVTWILAASIVLQFIAVYFTLRLIKLTGKSLAWGLVAAAIALMALRRSVSFSQIILSETAPMPDLTAELIALTISVLMVIGIKRITPIIVGMRSASDRQREQDTRYHTIFENSPVSIWEEDFSEIKRLFDHLRREGVRDIEAYFEQYPEAVQQCAELVKIVDVNCASMVLHGAESKEELLSGLSKTFTLQSFDSFREELMRLWRGDTDMSRDAVVKTLAGEPRYVTVNYAVCPGYEESLAKVFVSLADITERKRAENALTSSERQFRTLAENLPFSIIRYDREGRAVYLNPALEEILGIKAKDRIGKRVREFHTDGSYESYARAIDRILAGEEYLEFEFTLPLKSADPPIHMMRMAAERDEHGELTGVLAISHDITERKRAEQELRESEAKYRRIVDTATEGILFLDEHGKVTFINKHMAQMLGYTIAELQDHEVTDFMFEEDLEDHRQKLMSREQNVAEVYERRLIRKDGTVLWVLVSATPVFDGDRYQGVFSMVTDITERKRMEEELRASEQRFHAIFEQSFQFIGLMSTDGILLEANRAALNFAGSEEREVIGKPFWETPWWSHSVELQQQLREAIRKAAHGKFVRMEVTHPDPEGDIHYVDFSLTPVTDSNGRVVQIIPEGRDITERKLAEQERQVHAAFLDNMDRVNCAIQSAGDMEIMMRDVLDEVLEIFNCDRAFLMYPCDPTAETWTVPMERTRREYPGAGVLNEEITMDEEVAGTLELLLSNQGALKFGPETDRPLPTEVAERYGFKSFMSIALFPKVGKAWQFGLHQCSYGRIWTEAEEQLLQGIGRRLADGLSSLLVMRDLRESEEKYRRIVDTAREGILFLDKQGKVTFLNNYMAGMLGYSVDELQDHEATDFMFEEDLEDHRQKLISREQNIAEAYERRLIRKDGTVLWVLVSANPVFDGDRYQGVFSMVTDITERKKMEEELRASEQRFHAIFEQSFQFIGLMSTDGIILEANRAGLTFAGIEKSEVIGKPFWETYWWSHSPELQQQLREAIQRAAAGEFVRMEVTHPDREGNIHYVDFSLTPVTDSDGRVVQIIPEGRDITERKLAEQERQVRATLLGNMDRVNRAIQGAGDVETLMHDVLEEVLEVFSCDRAFLMYPCDPAAKTWAVPMECANPEYPGLGILNEEIPMEEHVARTMELLLSTSGAMTFGPGTGRPLTGDIDQRFGIRSMISIALQPKVGKPWQFGLHQCSYERVWTEEERQLLEEIAKRLSDALTSLLVLRNMRESERRLVEAQRLAHVGNWELDLINDTLAWSDEIFRIFQIDKNKFGASYEAFLDAIHPDDRDTVDKAYTESVKTRQPYDMVHRLLLPGGGIKYVREMCETLYDAAGKPLRSLGTVQDITEQKQREEELQRYRDHLEEEVHQRTDQLRLARNAAEAANQAKSVFLANMSHELRTPLNAILGFSQMMQQDAGLSQAQHETLDIINNSGEHLLKLINDVLEIAKIEAGKLQLERSTFDLHALVREVSDMMRLRAKEKGLQLELDQSPEFPRFIKGDEARMRQILVNLVSNAVKFTEQGGVTVRLRDKHNAQHLLLIEVEDSGPGISKKDQQRLFQPFVQLPEGKTQVGTGLGLSIVRQFIKLMGGAITVESTPGKGSLFRVELPMDAAEETDIDRLVGERHGEVTGLVPGQPAYKILIAEDQRDNQLLLTKLMTAIGLEVQVADNGEECVELFKKWKPDLIWMDRRMPVMDGVEATRCIRRQRGGKKVKIVAVTASAFREQEEELRSFGMDDYVSKPYRFNEIYDCLTRQLGLKFLYSEEEQITRGPAAALTPELLSGIGEELQTALRQALETLDSERIEEIMGRIAQKNSALARMLKGLTDNYDYPTILQVLDESMSSRDEGS